MIEDDVADSLMGAVRKIKDYPKAGVVFCDLNPIYGDGLLSAELVQSLYERLGEQIDVQDVDYVVAAEARGFILGSRLAASMDCGFIPVRKRHKLPPPVMELEYELEYGSDWLVISRHLDLAGKKVVIHDDVLATGGTAKAAYDLVTNLGAETKAFVFSLAVDDLDGEKNLPEDIPVLKVLSA